MRQAALPVEISIGSATATPGDTVSRLVARADAAMYRDKYGGHERDC